MGKIGSVIIRTWGNLPRDGQKRLGLGIECGALCRGEDVLFNKGLETVFTDFIPFRLDGIFYVASER